MSGAYKFHCVRHTIKKTLDFSRYIICGYYTICKRRKKKYKNKNDGKNWKKKVRKIEKSDKKLYKNSKKEEKRIKDLFRGIFCITTHLEHCTKPDKNFWNLCEFETPVM